MKVHKILRILILSRFWKSSYFLFLGYYDSKVNFFVYKSKSRFIKEGYKHTRGRAKRQQNANMKVWKKGYFSLVLWIYRPLKKLQTKIYTVNINPRLLPKLVVQLNLPTITNSWFFLPLGSCFSILLNEWQLDWYNIKPYWISPLLWEECTHHDLPIISSLDS